MTLPVWPRRWGTLMTRLRVVSALLVIITTMAVFTNYGLYYRVSYILFMVLVLSYIWTWLNGRWVKVAVTRDIKATSVGGWLGEHLTVSNHSRFLPVGWVELQEVSDMPDHGGAMVVSLPSSSFDTWTLRTLCKQRGAFTLGPVSVVSSDPLGLFKKGRVTGDPYSFLVYPATRDLPRLFVPVSDLAGESASRQYTQVLTPNAAGIREYAPGDSFNRVHWKTTARVGKLMVKEFDLEESTKIWIVLDMQEAVQSGEAAESTEEYGVTAAASIAKKYLEAGLSVGLISHGDTEVVLNARTGSNQQGLIMEALALIRARGSMGLEEVLSSHEPGFDRFFTVVVITSSADESWLGPLRFLSQKRVETSVVLLEAQTFGQGGSILPVVGSLAAGRVPFCVVRKGDDLSTALDFGYTGRVV